MVWSRVRVEEGVGTTQGLDEMANRRFPPEHIKELRYQNVCSTVVINHNYSF